MTDRISKFPVVVFGSEYWRGLTDWFKDTLLKRGSISKEDLHLFKVTDSPKEVVKIIKQFYNKHKELR